jgi:hypothetical protein
MEIEEETSTKQVSTRTIVIVCSLLLLAIWGAWFVYYYTCFGGMPTTEGSAGTFGDFFGSLNSLLSGGALVGAILAIYLQSRELKETQKQIRLQVKEAKETKEEFELQRATNALYHQITQYTNTDVGQIRKLASAFERVNIDSTREDRNRNLIAVAKKAESAVNALYTLTKILESLISELSYKIVDIEGNDRNYFQAESIRKGLQLFTLYKHNVGASQIEALVKIGMICSDKPEIKPEGSALYDKLLYCRDFIQKFPLNSKAELM